jgi:RNAse (barnase) inhibitor barstar
VSSPKTTYEIDGHRFSTLEEFFSEISRVLIPGGHWGLNLNAFNDILRGGFGTPDDGFRLIWKNHELSRQRLGYAETVRQLGFWLEQTHPSNRAGLQADLARARAETGDTVFDWLVKIIRDHGPVGDEAQDNVDLVLD